MLQVEVDLFSGRPNPQWVLTDEGLTKEIIESAAQRPGTVAQPHRGFQGLGFREVLVSQLSDDPRLQRGLPRAFALGSSASEDFEGSKELALAVVRTMERGREAQLVSHQVTPLSSELLELVLDRIQRAVRVREPGLPPAGSSNPNISTINDDRCTQCQYEVSQFNPGFWNAPAVQPHNNCYNYARNWRTDTFAQPGRAHGQQTNVMSCPTVTTAAMADGLVNRCNCLPASEWPRRLMALVIDPGVDYHWYRHQRGGFWGHKPGQTAARNTDNSGVVITNPETCDRGGYTDFCDYFYAGRSVVIN